MHWVNFHSAEPIREHKNKHTTKCEGRTKHEERASPGHTHTHTHTYTYIYIHIFIYGTPMYMQRGTEREREKDCQQNAIQSNERDLHDRYTVDPIGEYGDQGMTGVANHARLLSCEQGDQKGFGGVRVHWQPGRVWHIILV